MHLKVKAFLLKFPLNNYYTKSQFLTKLYVLILYTAVNIFSEIYFTINVKKVSFDIYLTVTMNRKLSWTII